MCLEFTELQVKNRKPMYMVDWIKLDDSMKLTVRDILSHAK